MRKFLLIAGIIIILVLGLGYVQFQNKNAPISSFPSQAPRQNKLQNETLIITTIAENLDTPWAITFLPDKNMLVTERFGRVRLIDSNGNLNTNPVAVIEDVRETGEGGLLGITVHPDFSSNNYIYLYYTYASSGNNTLNRVVRMTYKDNKLIEQNVIIDNIPGASNHNGGRIKFGPDKFLYISTGDAQNPSQAQDVNSLGGKILRVTDEGKPAPGNPFNNPVYSYGHRNVQGLAWDSNNRLWATEHGRSGAESGLDEINLIEQGKNYGWPVIQGNEQRQGMETPRINSGSTTWAPSGATFVGSSLFFSGLRGQALYKAEINNNQIVQIKEHFKSQYGRIREVILGQDGMLYITTSNKDGRGNPQLNDDKVIKIDPEDL
ncbi:MAG: PQQ-dependent sugar dehydrogenase [Candidatus Levybacteria bacterium]|nr:PQQ-dependent sugar dehydrogenase [Candidatus Levybacteria bacterium]